MPDFNLVTDIVRSVDSIVLDSRMSADVTVKGDADYITRTDTTVQEYLREKLKQIYPEAELVAEEKKQNNYNSRAEWILDPIDGTTNLMHGFGMSAVSLALYEDGVGIYGAVYNPFHGEMFTAVRGEGAYLNGKRIHTSERRSMKECIAVTEFSPYYKELSADVFEKYRQLFLRCQDIRSLGAAAIGLVYVACGRADIFMSRNLKPWDHAAADIIISEAGGHTSDFSGNPLKLDCLTEVLAGAPGVWNELREFSKSLS